MKRKSNCSDCGEYAWSFDGYCLSVTCAGYALDDDWPRTKPRVDKEPVIIMKEPKPPRSEEERRRQLLYYQSRGLTPPWL